MDILVTSIYCVLDSGKSKVQSIRLESISRLEAGLRCQSVLKPAVVDVRAAGSATRGTRNTSTAIYYSMHD